MTKTKFVTSYSVKISPLPWREGMERRGTVPFDHPHPHPPPSIGGGD